MISFVAVFIAIVSMSFVLNSDSDEFSPQSDNSCTVIVKYSGGSPASSVKVSTEVGGGISCVGGRTFYTDSNGEATVYWSEGCKLTYIYIDGTSYKGDYEDGGTYTFYK